MLLARLLTHPNSLKLQHLFPTLTGTKLKNAIYAALSKNLGTTLGDDVIEKAVERAPDHCAMVAQHWATLPESRADYWDGRKGSTSGALRLRLENPAWLPPKLYAQKQAAQKRAERAAEKREQEEREAAKIQEDAESMAGRRKEAWGHLQRIESLSKDQRTSLFLAAKKHPRTPGDRRTG